MKKDNYKVIRMFQRLIIVDVVTAVSDRSPVPIGFITSDTKEKRDVYAFAADTLKEIAINYDVWFLNEDKDNPYIENPFLDQFKEDISGLVYSRKLIDKNLKYRQFESIRREELLALSLYLKDIDKWNCFLEKENN